MSTVPFDDKILNRISQRRRVQGGCGCYWVRRRDTNSLIIFSAKDLSEVKRKATRLEPKSGVWLTPREATHHLATVALDLPGLHAMRWSGDWKRPSARDEDRKEATTFDLGEHPYRIVRPALEKAERELEDLCGDPEGYTLSRMSPEDIETIWLPILRTSISAEWRVS